MSFKKFLKAFQAPQEFYATYLLFRRLGAHWSEALKCAVECIVLYRFVIPC